MKIFRVLLPACAGIFSAFPVFAQDTLVLKTKISNPGKSINSAFQDYAPVISADGSLMIFTTRRPVTEKEIKKNKEAYERVFFSTFNAEKNKWENAQQIKGKVNIPGRHNSAIALSNDGQRMLLYRDDASGNGDIYESELDGEEWTQAEKLPEPVNSAGHESSASYSPDGRTIYFVSNRRGGQGGRDIWYCKKDRNGVWGKAENLGPVVNTKDDEEGVFIHPDGKTLYFSSKGHKGYGGYDLFKTSYEKGKWTKPVNLGSEINTEGDDLYLVVTADGKVGYYASENKSQNQGKDIYRIDFIFEKYPKNSGPKLTLFKGVVIDKETFDPLESVIEITDNDKNEVISQIKSNKTTGKFLISLPSGKNYGINVRKEGYLFYSDNLIIPDTSAYKEIIKVIPLEKLNVGNKIVLKNIFYDFDKATLRPESMSELMLLVKLMNENATLKIELSSHTDSKGSDEYNLKLSQARAQSVVDYLVKNGISPTRLTAKGYGESKPIADNETEEGRQLNRRTEFTILSK